MQNGIFSYPIPVNEPVLNYAPGSKERTELKSAIQDLKSQHRIIPMEIEGKSVFTDEKIDIAPPYDHQNIIGQFCKGNSIHVHQAIDAALKVQDFWGNTTFEFRASIFRKAAELLAGPYRQKINASTILAQSKNAYQAEIDSACELIDFLRFNIHFAAQIYAQQPISSPGISNRLDYRPLEGFIFAITPFNFTAIAGNLPTAPALMGNVVVWKPAESQIYSAYVIMEVLSEAGLPDGVINLIYTDGPETGDIVFKHPDFAGVHFTGSTPVFQHFWKTIGENIHRYKSYPRIVGETGGKDFVMVHPSANPQAVCTALVRGSFEFQGQKCSAASRAYIPQSLWPELKAAMGKDLSEITTGSPEDFIHFVNAVIDEKSFDKIVSYIEKARVIKGNEIIFGGTYDKSKGYFIQPTVILSEDPKSLTMMEEIFGPVLTIYIYKDENYEATLDLVNTTSPYALTGAIFSEDRKALELALQKLRQAAGNFYINDKPTGAVVGQQPFGGSRASGTNDKAGSYLNLLRWVSPRNIKETFVPPTDYKYPFLEKD